eukprot:Gregarina_sp_Poly_1__3925@NODE_2178_length_2546_cov_214_139169_g1403_i0_p1_GENE_NODE_2178_length_2546_cov_214_139169_g1403_i0NODE_2178_length_2546_cov_214_139169_g1403_i0_p1_ORF_typecomplete_len420_score28_04MFS_1/PF07690_16/1_6e12MFS_1/PF07690_16/1_5e11MFS_2/PF13347_6/1_4e02MFS_2/PF13347_6/1_1e08MFS_4/PF06779_14/0_0012MFS_3/PF05977_13/6_8MFS_3/PF05977_13/78MFS_3/PF05977_13/0_19DUF3955/PF13127_6/1_7e02DUF3955/PF13127_6/1_5e04DUF3955/PF13127_6/3_8DUF3955/PF13127_6/1_6e02DUF3955/PF13127_6/3e02_NOD
MPPAAKLLTARVCCTMLFFILGMNIGSWVSAMPGLKRGFHLGPGQLGLAIMCSGLASLGMAIPAGRLVDILGCRAISFSSGVFGPIAYMTLPTLAKFGLQPYLPLFFLNVISAGGFISCNARALELEVLWNKPIMSSFHAAFSVGGLVGSACYSALLAQGFHWNAAFPVMCLATMVASFVASLFMDVGLKHCHVQVHSQEIVVPPCSWVPNPYVLLLGGVAALTLLTEGAIGDWSALYLQEYDKCPYALAPLGYSSFAASMGLMRILGDCLCNRFGRQPVYRVSALFIAVGIIILLASRSTPIGMIACATVGIGCANILPILMSVVGRHGLPNPGISIAAVSSLGNAGLLTGPAIIGFVAQSQGLRVGLSLLVVGAVVLNIASIFVVEGKAQRTRSYTEAFALPDEEYSGVEPSLTLLM